MLSKRKESSCKDKIVAKKLNKYQKLFLDLFCVTYVSGHFADFLNPKYRVGGYQWSSFPSLVLRLIKVDIFMSYSPEEYEKFKDIIQEYLDIYIPKIARDLLRRSGLDNDLSEC
jgi:hypothetical protein